MSNLINRDALLEAIDAEFFKTDPMSEEQLGFLTCRRITREFPSTAVDAEPVVRCGECIHSTRSPFGHTVLRWCPMQDTHKRPDWFCADGKKKEVKD